MKGFKDSKGKFHPIKDYKGVRKSRDQKAKTQGIKIRKQRAVTKRKLPDVDLRENWWGFETTDGIVDRMQLGNLTDAGWYWTGEHDDLNTFMIRIAKSEVSNEFMNAMNENGITFDMIKNQMLKNLSGKLTDANDDGLYVLSGDNSRWKFHEDDDSIDLSSEYDYAVDEGIIVDRDEFEEEFWNHYTGVNYEDYLKDKGEGWRKELIKTIKESKDFDDYFDRINEITEFPYGEMEEDFREYHMNNIGFATGSAIEAIKARQDEEGKQT